MAEPLSRTMSRTSSDLFEPDDPEFVEILLHTKLPGDVSGSSQGSVSTQQDVPTIELSGENNSLKRPRSPSPDLDLADTKECSLDSGHGAPQSGGSGDCVRRKRARLQTASTDSPSSLFRGLAIYINGQTEPSVQELRQLILQHGGVFHADLDNRGLVTHIITCSLTPANVREFKHMNVVRPEWLVESVRAGELLPCQDFVFQVDKRVESRQNTRSLTSSHFDTSATRKMEPSTASESTETETVSFQVFQTPPPQLGQSNQPISKHNSTAKAPNISSLVYKTDPGSPAQSPRVPKYAAHASNPNAQRVMADPEWRSAHTSASSDFIEGYYKHSRLHHLSLWKAELKKLVAEAQERAESGLTSGKSQIFPTLESTVGSRSTQATANVSMKGTELIMKSPKSKGKGKADQERIIMHCDFDSFFVSAGLVSRPHLHGKPVVVCHSQGSQGGTSSTSEISSANYEARKYGVKNGMSLQQARKLCPIIMTIPYEFELYKQYCLKFYTILMSLADDLQAVSVDEALIDVTSGVEQIRMQMADRVTEGETSNDPAKRLAEIIRDQVREATSCEVSIGIAHNILLARIATRRAKPAGSYHILPSDVQNVLPPLDIADLHGFGFSTQQKAREKLGVTKLGELASKSKSMLCDALGKSTGETLYKAIRGIDDRKLESDKPRKSVSCDINYGIRFENNEQAEAFVFQLAEEVSRRLEDVHMRGGSVTLKIMKRDPAAPVEAPKFMGHGRCETFNKQMPLVGPDGRATSDSKAIGKHAWGMLKLFNFDPKDLRGIGIQIQKLEPASAPANLGQARLPFKSIESPTKAKEVSDNDSVDDVEIVVHPPSLPKEPVENDENVNVPIVDPSKSFDNLDLPSLSQVDQEVLNALPEDLRQELETEYKRRSVSPIPAQKTPEKPRSRLSVKGTNYKRITQQLSPRNRPVMTSPESHRLFRKQEGPTVQVPETVLRKLDIDPEVFGLLPAEVQSEQLALARQAKSAGNSPSKAR